MKNDLILLKEVYVEQISKGKYSQIVSIINESKYSRIQKQILIEYTTNNINAVVHLYEADMSRRGFLGALGKAALGVGAASMGLGDNKAQAQEQSNQIDPFNQWIEEIEAWKQVFAPEETESTISGRAFNQVIQKLKSMSNTDKQDFNESCKSSSTNAFRGAGNTQSIVQQKNKYGPVVWTRNFFIRGPRFLGSKSNGIYQPTLQFLSKVMKQRKPNDILKFKNPRGVSPALEKPNTWESLELDTYP